MKQATNPSGSMTKIIGFILIAFIIILAIYYFVYDRNSQEKAGNNYETAKALMAEKKFKDSVKYLEKAVNANPDNVEYLKDLAVAHYNSINYKAAITVYERIIALDSNDAFSYNGLGNAYRDLGDELAVEYYLKAIKANPNYIVSYNNLAQLYLTKGKKGEATQILIDGLKNNPDSQELKNALDNVK